MLEKLDRSWDLTKTTFRVIREDKELFAYPILSSVVSVLFMIAMIGPTIFALLFSSSTVVLGLVQYTLLFVLYFGLAFIAVFFNTCVAYTAKVRFEGGNATIASSIGFGFSRIGAILKWSLLSATVGFLLRMAETAARNVRGIGRIVIQLVVAAVGMSWSVLTMFVVPSLAYQGHGPVDSIKDSIRVLKKTWGEALIKYVGLETVRGTCIMVATVLLTPLAVIGYIHGNDWLMLVAVVLMILSCMIIGLVFGVANSVFNTALYAYATTGKVPFGYASHHMTDAFQRVKEAFS